jgi:hypothetical protein
LIFAVESFVIDAAGVHLAEAELAALRDEAAAVAGVFIVELLLVFVADRRAIDDDARALDRLFGLETGLHVHVLELAPAVLVDSQLRAFHRKRVDFGAVGQQRSPLVEGDVVETPLLAKGGENADQRLADRPGTDDMNDFLFCGHGVLSPFRKS